jgi:hypothetical protein
LEDRKTKAVLTAAQKAAGVSPTVVEAWAPPEQDGGEKAALRGHPEGRQGDRGRNGGGSWCALHEG